MSQEDGFLARWSRRKALVRQGEAPPPEPAPAPPAVPAVTAAAVEPEATGAKAAPATAESAAVATEAAPPPPTLAEAEALTPEADFSRFVARDVDPAVKNTALKKLFADPHFNVMDGLDTYIDDYGIPDPLPAGMLQKMSQSAFLGLFTAPEAAPAEASPAATLPDSPAGATAEPPPPSPEPIPDEDPDLRLQPHDASGHGGDQPRAGQDPGREH